MIERNDRNMKRPFEGILAAGRSTKSLAASGIGALLLLAGASTAHTEGAKVETVSVDADESVEGEQKPFDGRRDGVELDEGEEMMGAIVPLDTFVLNISGGKYIRVQMQIEFDSPDVPKRFYSRAVPIRDSIITYLTEQKAEDLQTTKGKDELRQGLRKLVNEQLKKDLVRRVYFTQFVIQ